MLAVNIITIFNLLLLFSLLWFRKNNSLPNKLLALIIINPGLNFLGNINILLGNIYDFPHTIFFFQITSLLFAPLLYNYVQILMGNKFRPFYWLHLISGAVVCLGIYFWIEFLTFPKPIQTEYLDGLTSENYPYQINIINGFFIILQQVYFSFAAINIYRYNKKVRNFMSDLSSTKLLFLINLIILVWLLNLITIGLYASLDTIHVEYIWLPIVLNIIFGFIIYYSFNHNGIFSSQKDYLHFSATTISLDEMEVFKPQKKAPSLHLASTIKNVLSIDGNLYKRTSLTIKDLANEIDQPVHVVSNCINTEFNQTFNELINGIRIKKAKEIILNNTQNWSLEAIGIEVGFSTRAAFYRWFKRIENQTPGNFLESKQPLNKITTN